jgi:hypothetical protein
MATIRTKKIVDHAGSGIMWPQNLIIVAAAESSICNLSINDIIYAFCTCLPVAIVTDFYKYKLMLIN